MLAGKPAGLYWAVHDVGGVTYFHWFHEGDPTCLRGEGKLDEEHGIRDALAAIVQALPGGNADDAVAEGQAVEAALASEMWSSREKWLKCFRGTLSGVMPENLRQLICEQATSEQPIRLKVAATGRWAVFPWELLPVGDEKLLLDIADIQMVPPASLVSGRAREPVQPADTAVPLYVIDPDSGLPILESHADSGNPTALWLERVRAGRGWTRGWDVCEGVRNWYSPSVSRQQLSEELTQNPPSRLLVFAHCVAGENGVPARTGIVLSDQPRPGASATVYLRPAPDAEREPLTAEMLIRGEGQEFGKGHQLWPFPPRAAIIACASGVDSRHLEPWGLVAAAINAGAEYLTATRWALPADSMTGGATTRLALAVDDAMAEPDPIKGLGGWIREQARQWGAESAISPLLWSSLTTFKAPSICGDASEI